MVLAGNLYLQKKAVKIANKWLFWSLAFVYFKS